jgi:hypothetical protein
MAVVLAALAVPRPAIGQATSHVVAVPRFLERVIDRGGEMEDWQPAFQAAIEVAQDEGKPLYVPPGEYKIRQAISIIPDRPLRIFGDGRYQSIISQQVDTENCVDWTALAYEDLAVYGALDCMRLTGGNITLNIKWHNHFVMTSCRIDGAKSAGIHAEGWSNRFLNSDIRWCAGYGIYGGEGGHVNNVVVRDCYIGRCGIGIYLNGANGSRIEGTCFEASNSGIFLGPVQNITINNCYFEGVGSSELNPQYMEDGRLKYVDGYPGEPPFNNIHTDYCRQVTIHDNIFRGQHDKDGAYISITVLVNGHIYDNQVQGSQSFVKLTWDSKTRRGKPYSTSRLENVVVENNGYLNVEDLLVEEEGGLIEKAIANQSVFRMRPRIAYGGSPVGNIQPQCLGDEILDTETNTWYKANGPTTSDWVALN